MTDTPKRGYPIPDPGGSIYPQVRDMILAVDDDVDALTPGGAASVEVYDVNEHLLGTATGVRAPDIELDGDVAVFPFMPLLRTQTQIDAMSPPIPYVLYANTTKGKLQYFDTVNWIVLGTGSGVIGIPPSVTASWESDHGVTGSPASAWASLDNTVTLAQASGSSRPAVTSGAFGSTVGLTFDGINDHLTVATKVIAATGSATISVVFKTGAAIGGPMVLVSQSDTAVSNDWFEFGIGADGRLYVESNNAGTKLTVKGSTVLFPATVYDAQLSFDGTDYFLLLKNAEENPLTIDNIGSFAWFGRVGGTTSFTVGATLTSGGVQRPFAGVIGGVYLWAEDLTA